MEMVLTSRRVSEQEAEKMGLITRAVEPERLDEEVQKTLAQLISNHRRIAFVEAVYHLCGALARVAATEDAKEGIKAFLEKRPPNFKGR